MNTDMPVKIGLQIKTFWNDKHNAIFTAKVVRWTTAKVAYCT